MAATRARAPAFGNLLKRSNFLHHYLNSQQPGTIDTSLVSTDHINNSNTINAVFDVPARVARALVNQPEAQSPANQLLRSVPGEGPVQNPRLTPRVLLDGSDSVSVFGSLIRVPLNIGTFSEEWASRHNPILEFKPQKPFSVAVCQKNSVFWQVNERYRIDYLAAFFTMKKKPSTARGPATATARPPEPVSEQSSTGPMKLVNTPEGRVMLADPQEQAKAGAGRRVWLRNGAVCHSSKQPEGYRLEFSRALDGRWETAPAPQSSETEAPAPPHYTLPTDFANWVPFTRSPAFQDYRQRITKLHEESNGQFFVDNFLASEVRVPVTLVGTNSGRAMATNAKRDQVWDNFPSESYKNLPSVGRVRYFNAFSAASPDPVGNNDDYPGGEGGPGYYRPATHIGIWATAPFLHNNALG